MSADPHHVDDATYAEWTRERDERAREDRDRLDRSSGRVVDLICDVPDREARAAAARMLGDEGASWRPVDLQPFIDGNHEAPAAEYLHRSDGHALLYPGRLHSLSGEPESGKSWLMVAAAAQLFDEYDDAAVVYIDFEDTPQSVVARLLAAGVAAATVARRFVYVRPEAPVVDRMQLYELALAADMTVRLVVLDGVTEGMVLHGLDPLSNTDIARWREQVVRPLVAGCNQAATVELDHVVKDKEARGRYALGGIHKLAGVDVAYGVKVLVPFGRGRDGTLKLTVHKDRPGHVRGFAAENVAALVDLSSHDEGDRVVVTLRPPDVDADRSTFRPTVLMERVSRAIEDAPGLSQRAIRDTVKGTKTDVKLLALELLIAEGNVRVEPDGQARRHYIERPFREDTDTDRSPGPQPVPNRSQDRCEVTGPPVPPLKGPGTGHTNGATPTGPRSPTPTLAIYDHEPETAA